jgi:glutaredoxin
VTEAIPQPRLTLYVGPGCMYCAQVEHAARRLEIELDRRSIVDDQSMRELMAARGRATVPVLRVDDAGGNSQWIPESLDIIRELKTRAGKPDPVPRWVDRILGVSRPIVLLLVVAAMLAPAAWGPPLFAVAIALVVLEILRRYLAIPRAN